MIEVLQLLNEVLQNTPTIYSNHTIRHLDKDEPLPQFGHGYPDSPLLQREWIWLAYRRLEPVAILIAAPAQGMAHLMRIYVKDYAPPFILVALLRKVFADIRSRGYNRYCVFLDDNQQECKDLRRLVIKAGGEAHPSTHTLLYGDTGIKGY